MRCRKRGRSLMERLEVRVLLSAAYVPQLEAVEPVAVIPAVRAHRHHHRRRVDPAVTIAPEVTSVPPAAADAPPILLDPVPIGVALTAPTVALSGAFADRVVLSGTAASGGSGTY